MSTPFMAEIRIYSFDFPPKGWASCDGQILPINQNQALFSLLGTTYGGNGQTTFALPDLRGHIPIHIGQGHVQGERAGQESHTLIQSEMPAHTHPVSASDSNGTRLTPSVNSIWSATTTALEYSSSPTGVTAMHPNAIEASGGSQPHSNMPPYLTLNFSIALQGIFPSRN